MEKVGSVEEISACSILSRRLSYFFGSAFSPAIVTTVGTTSFPLETTSYPLNGSNDSEPMLLTSIPAESFSLSPTAGTLSYDPIVIPAVASSA